MRSESPHQRRGLVLFGVAGRNLILTVCIAALSCLNVAQARAQAISEFLLPNPAGPRTIVTGPDGNLWFTDGGQIRKMTPTGEVTSFPITTPDSLPFGIVVGWDGNLWYTQVNGGGRIGRITTAGAVTEFPVPTADSTPLFLTLASDGNIWFTERDARKIGVVGERFGSGFFVTDFALPDPTGPEPKGITSGPDGNVWYARGNRIGRFAPTLVNPTFTEFTLPSGGAYAITTGPDGNLWYAGGNVVGRVTTAGVVTQFPAPDQIIEVIAAGPDGNVWAGGGLTGTLLRVTPTGVITTFQIPVRPPTTPYPRGITIGPDGNLWFTEFAANRIGRIVPPPVSRPVVAALLPGRSVRVGTTASAFVTMLNSGTTPATNCGPAPVTPVPATYTFQTTNPATNTLTGTPNTKVSIPAGAVQTFAVFFRANGGFPFQDMRMGYGCTGTAAVSIVGVNTFPLTFSTAPVPDVITVGDTSTHDGFARIPGVGGSGFMVTAATNIGAAGNLTARVRLLDPTTPVNVSICETNSSGPQVGQCKATPAASVTRTLATNENTTWTAFFTATAQFAQDPARFRALFEFVDAGGTTVRGQTSTALTLQ